MAVGLSDKPNTVITTGDDTAIVVSGAGIQGGQGETGATGAQGPAGSAASIAIGSTTTLAAGAAATVVNSGSSSAAVFDFGIPQGATGAQGPAGTAATITVGTVTSGTAPAVTNSGTSTAAVLNFTLQKGDKGDTGATGATGATGPEGGTSTLTTKGDLLGRSSSAVARVAVGTDGYVLTADSTQTTGVKWGLPSPAFWTRWGNTRNYGIPDASLVDTGSFALAANTDWFFLFQLSRRVVVDAIATQVMSTGTGNMRIGLTKLDKFGVPTGAPILDSGDISTSTTGVKEYIPASAVTLDPGGYAFVLNKSNAAPAIGFWMFLPAWGNSVPATMGTSVYQMNSSYSRTYGAFPTPLLMSTPSTTTLATNTSVRIYASYVLMSVSNAAP